MDSDLREASSEPAGLKRAVTGRARSESDTLIGRHPSIASPVPRGERSRTAISLADFVLLCSLGNDLIHRLTLATALPPQRSLQSSTIRSVAAFGPGLTLKACGLVGKRGM
jgi:hypothetical protein